MANLYGDDHADILTGSPANDELYGGANNDTLAGGNAILQGAGTQDDPRFITPFELSANDYLEGGTGDDSIWGFDGNDVIYGGDGNDSGVAFHDDLPPFGGFWTAGLFGGDSNDTRLYRAPSCDCSGCRNRRRPHDNRGSHAEGKRVDRGHQHFPSGGAAVQREAGDAAHQFRQSGGDRHGLFEYRTPQW